MHVHIYMYIYIYIYMCVCIHSRMSGLCFAQLFILMYCICRSTTTATIPIAPDQHDRSTHSEHTSIQSTHNQSTISQSTGGRLGPFRSAFGDVTQCMLPGGHCTTIHIHTQIPGGHQSTRSSPCPANARGLIAND